MPLSTDDHIAIQQLYARYNHAIDFGNAEAWAACVTPDGVFNAGPMGEFAGAEALKSFATGFAQQLKARHWTNNLVLEGDTSAATGTCYLLLWSPAGGEKPASVITSAVYEDELNKNSGSWLFTRRAVKADA